MLVHFCRWHQNIFHRYAKTETYGTGLLRYLITFEVSSMPEVYFLVSFMDMDVERKMKIFFY